ncbi:FAD-dependent oxidoreductase [Luteococcus sp. H138]|uniref:NAD(P)/FAD-dependent oxidoreductase n=1 Tax=unclassified Luteococcus TaxID=2639923 RepID=UPI00313CD9F9
MRHVVIVGGGLAGFTTAQEVRRLDAEARISVVDPLGLPHDRPPLSKEYLTGEMPQEKLPFHPEPWFEEQRIDLHTDRVERIVPDRGRVELASGETLEADVMVLAQGGRARTLPIPGGDLPGILQLRTIADADRLKALLRPGVRLAIIGAGLIGAEVAATAAEAGAEVTLVDPVPVPLAPVVGTELAGRLHGMHAEHGVRVCCAATESIQELGANSTSDPARSPSLPGGYRLTLADGTTLEADAVLVAVGLVPNTELAEAAGLAVDNGVLVDEAQHTGVGNVYAVGDAARHRLPDGTLARRHEHWESAMRSGQSAAAAICGQPLWEHGAGWMWSDRYGVHVEAVGDLVNGTPVTRVVDGLPVTTFQLDERGRMIGAAGINVPKVIRAARRIIDRGLIVPREVLEDPTVDLKPFTRG